MRCPRCGTPPIMRGQKWCHMCGEQMKRGRWGEIVIALLKCLCYYLLYDIISGFMQTVYTAVVMGRTRALGYDVYVGEDYSPVFWQIFSEGYSGMMIFTYALVFTAVLMWFLLRGKKPLHEMGIRRFRGSELPGIVLFGLAAQAVTSITVSLVSVFTGPLGEETEQAYDSMFGDETSFAMFLFMAVATPIIEELIFRGLIYTRMRSVMKPGAAVMLSALVFGLCHGEFYRVVYATLLGVLLAVFFERYNSLVPCIVLHAAFNSMSFIYEVLPESSLVFFSLYFISIGVTLICMAYFFMSQPIYGKENQQNETL